MIRNILHKIEAKISHGRENQRKVPKVDVIGKDTQTEVRKESLRKEYDKYIFNISQSWKVYLICVSRNQIKLAEKRKIQTFDLIYDFFYRAYDYGFLTYEGPGNIFTDNFSTDLSLWFAASLNLSEAQVDELLSYVREKFAQKIIGRF